MLPWKIGKRQILPVSQNPSSVYFSLAKFQLVSCNLSLAMIWQMTYAPKLPKLCSATLRRKSGARKEGERPDTQRQSSSLHYLPVPLEKPRLVKSISG